MDNSSETQHNVVTMTSKQHKSGYAALSVVEAYWEALRAGREMPKRAEIDPRGIESALEHAFILERVAPGVARMRIAGSHLHDLMGMEPRGMPITAFFDQEARIKIAAVLEEVFQKPATAEIIMHSISSVGQPSLEARMVLLPLKSDLGDVSRILGCLVAAGEIGTAPRRFSLRDVTIRTLGRGGTVQATPKPNAFQEPAAGFEPPAPSQSQSQSQSPMQANNQTAKRPPYLTLVKSD